MLTKKQAEAIYKTLCAAGHTEYDHDVEEEPESAYVKELRADVEELESRIEEATKEPRGWCMQVYLNGATPEAIETIVHEMHIPGTRLQRVYDELGDDPRLVLSLAIS